MVVFIRIAIRANDPSSATRPQGAWIASTARWPGSLQRIGRTVSPPCVRLELCRYILIARVLIAKLVKCLIPQLALRLSQPAPTPRAELHDGRCVSIVAHWYQILVPRCNPINHSVASLVRRLHRMRNVVS